MVLGELEKLVLNYLWQEGEADVKQIHAILSQERQSSLNTIQSTLERLYKKKLLSRSKQGHAYQYRARVEREELIAQLIKDVASDFKTSRDETGLMAAFVSLSSELSMEDLNQLEHIIEQRRLQDNGLSK
ncbi:BlaI/MecI/CopY family transcriptional regulator [Rhodanobacter aciditrophus]|uniref:BlaI/MecI/CopY family transcriptional regulator n=1 Tax=Rhodanobacter aciditrophus TaxID=1623218 RepID=A0ABW4B315_9GAMM